MAETRMRTIDHPGPVVESPVQSLPTRILTVKARIPAGVSLLDGFADLLRHYGCQSAVARLGSSRLWPVAYVLPAISRSPDHAVYYSERHCPEHPLSLTSGAVTVGSREGQTWLHCHARWQDEAGIWHCGHLLPDETMLADHLDVELTLLLDAGFVVCYDTHTNFSLFKPQPMQALGYADVAPEHGLCVRIAPNVDLCKAIEAICQDNRLTEVRILGGVGSTIGAVFDDGRVVEPFVTELMIEKGHVVSRHGRAQAHLEVALIDFQGGVHRGTLARGQNPVLVTCEFVLA